MLEAVATLLESRTQPKSVDCARGQRATAILPCICLPCVTEHAAVDCRQNARVFLERYPDTSFTEQISEQRQEPVSVIRYNIHITLVPNCVTGFPSSRDKPSKSRRMPRHAVHPAPAARQKALRAQPM